MSLVWMWQNLHNSLPTAVTIVFSPWETHPVSFRRYLTNNCYVNVNIVQDYWKYSLITYEIYAKGRQHLLDWLICANRPVVMVCV